MESGLGSMSDRHGHERSNYAGMMTGHSEPLGCCNEVNLGSSVPRQVDKEALGEGPDLDDAGW